METYGSITMDTASGLGSEITAVLEDAESDAAADSKRSTNKTVCSCAGTATLPRRHPV